MKAKPPQPITENRTCYCDGNIRSKFVKRPHSSALERFRHSNAAIRVFSRGSASTIAESSASPLSMWSFKVLSAHLHLKLSSHPSLNFMEISLLSCRDALHMSNSRMVSFLINGPLIKRGRLAWLQIQEIRTASSFRLTPVSVTVSLTDWKIAQRRLLRRLLSNYSRYCWLSRCGEQLKFLLTPYGQLSARDGLFKTFAWTSCLSTSLFFLKSVAYGTIELRAHIELNSAEESIEE